MSNQDKINEFGTEMVNLIEKYRDELKSTDIAWILMENAVTCCLCCAPNELEGVKFILECVQMGITMYEQNHS